tara:strand:- start:654 stop:881 length:228 start_codon:yes stop_codon:yes gene_type:complete
MNLVLIVALLLLIVSFYGGSKCPTILRKNKDILLGTVIGLALCSFMNIRLEAMSLPEFTEAIAGRKAGRWVKEHV